MTNLLADSGSYFDVPGADAAPGGNPFPGLRPFRQGEEHLFFGRERQVDAMIEKLARTRFLAVVGTSGSGKSSLVNCGLLPALSRGLMTSAGPSWRVVEFRPSGNPLRAMAAAIASHEGLYPDYHGEVPLAEIIETHLRLSSRGFVDVVKKVRLPERTNLLLVVDQFEELFRYRKLRAAEADRTTAAEDTTAFVNLLLEGPADPSRSIYVVLTMRSDFLGDCSLFLGLPEAMNDSQYLVPRLTRDERRAVIAGPIAVGGATIDPVLLTRLVNDVGENPDQLSLLQHALNRTWARWRHHAQPDKPISLEDYESVGAMSEALDRHAEKAYNQLREGRPRKICERLFKALTDTGTDARGIRRPATFERLCAITGSTPAELKDVIDVFRRPSRSFLMPPVSENLEPATIVDISHESLMRVWQRLATWTEEEAQSARIYRRLADSAALHAGGHTSLWRDPELQFTLNWRQKREPCEAWAALYGGGFEPAMAFLDRSRDARDRTAAEAELERRWRSSWRIPIAALSAILLLLFLDQFFKSYSDLTAHVLTGWLASAGLPAGGTSGGIARAVAVLVVFTVTAMPAVLTYVLLEHFGRRAYRRATLGRTIREIVEEESAGTPETSLAVDEAAQPDVRWHTSYASAGPRLRAGLIDGLVSIVAFFLAFFAVAIVEVAVQTLATGQSSNEMTDTGAATAVGLWVVLSCLYQAIPLSGAVQATPGMLASGIFAVSISGKRLSFGRALLRHLTKPLSYGVFGIGLLLQLSTPRRQTLHDLLSRSVVLLTPEQPREEPAAAAAEPAATGRRMLASAIDLCVAIGLYFAIGVPAFAIFVTEGEVSDAVGAVVFGFWVLAYLLYQAWTISSASQATFGMRAAGVHVSSNTGGRLSFGRAAWRQMAKAPSYVSVVGLLMQPFGPRKQALHDLLSGSSVLAGSPRHEPAANAPATGQQTM